MGACEERDKIGLRFSKGLNKKRQPQPIKEQLEQQEVFYYTGTPKTNRYSMGYVVCCVMGDDEKEQEAVRMGLVVCYGDELSRT